VNPWDVLGWVLVVVVGIPGVGVVIGLTISVLLAVFDDKPKDRWGRR